MERRFRIQPSWRLSLVCVAAVLTAAICSATPSRGDDNSTRPQSASAKAGESASQQSPNAAKAVVDSFVVPDGSADELLKFIAKTRSARAPRKQTVAEAQAFTLKKCEAIIAAADKILAAEPKASVRTSALQSKLQALSVLDDGGDDKAGSDLAALVDEMKNDKQPGVAKLANRYLAQAAEVTSAADAPKLEIKASHLDGSPFDPATIKRKVTLVELWTTSCGKCQAEMPNLARDYAKYRNRGFEVVGISLDGDKSAVEKYMQANPLMTWQVVLPQSGTGVSYPGQKAGQFGTPKMILINRRGAILGDSLTDEELTAKLAELLGR